MSTIPRQKLLALLAQFNISPAAFDALRADAYEKRIAAHSLTDLELLYATVLNPALSYVQMQPLCPPWPNGRQAGRPPALQTLCDIKHRIMAEQTLNDLGRMEKLLKSLRHRSTVQSVELQTELFNAVVALLGEELLSAKLDGKPIAENLPAVDRLIKVAALRLRQQQGEARLKLQERREDRLDRRQPGNQPEDPSAEPAEYEEDHSGLTEDEKSRILIERIYGPISVAKEPTRPVPAPEPTPTPAAPAVPPAAQPESPEPLTHKEHKEKNQLGILARTVQHIRSPKTPPSYSYQPYPDNFQPRPVVPFPKTPGTTN